MWAYFVCVSSGSYTVSVLILSCERFSSSAITPSCMLLSQNVTHASDSKGCACVMRTWLRFATERKKKPGRNFNSGVSLGKPELKKSLIRTVHDSVNSSWAVISRSVRQDASWTKEGRKRKSDDVMIKSFLTVLGQARSWRVDLATLCVVLQPSK